MGKKVKTGVRFSSVTKKLIYETPTPSPQSPPETPAPAAVVEQVRGADAPVVAGSSSGQPRRGIGAGKKNIKKPEPKPRQNQGKRSGLNFPVARIRRYMKEGHFGLSRISATSAVYMSAVMEYMVAEVLEVVIEQTIKHGRKTITPQFLNLAVREDQELNNLLGNVHIAGGGVVPHIHSKLLVKPPPKRRPSTTTKKDTN